MSIFYHIVADDPLDNGHGSSVMQGTPHCRIEGHDGQMRDQAFLGHRAYCGVCQSAGPIARGPGTPRDSLRMYDATIQAREAVEGDIVLCQCERSPKLVAVHGRRSYIKDDSAVQAGAGEGAAVTLAALAAKGAAVASPASAPTQQPSGDRRKTSGRRCILRIGMFFDGTRNNAGNTETFSQCRASTAEALGQDPQEQEAILSHCKPYMSDPSSSYGNGYTNVWRLYNLYRDSTREAFGEEDKEYFIPIYVEGIGTVTGKPDNTLGMALGIGETGILAKVEQAISKLIPQTIRRFSELLPDIAVEAIEFDVFGFSRGAAAARHFVHEVKRGHASPLLPAVQATRVKRVPEFVAYHDFRVNFVGLFDTVVSHASLADGFDVRRHGTGPVKVALPAGCARKVVQLVARDEHRANFMLTTVSPPHQDIALPGAHSDIGGGYRDQHEGPLMLIQPIRSPEMPIEHDGQHYLPPPEQTDAWRKADTLRQLWKRRLGAIDDEHLRVDGWVRMEERTIRQAGAQRVRQPVAYATLRLDRPVDWRYQLIPLRVMHRLALQAGVMFKPIPDDDDHALPAELEPIAAQLLAGQSLSWAQENLLARAYLHQSANWNLARYQRSTGPELIYVNRPDPSGKRGVLDNQDK